MAQIKDDMAAVASLVSGLKGVRDDGRRLTIKLIENALHQGLIQKKELGGCARQFCQSAKPREVRSVANIIVNRAELRLVNSIQ